MKHSEIDKNEWFNNCSIFVKKEELPNSLLYESIESINETVMINISNKEHFKELSSILEGKEYILEDNGNKYLIVGDIAIEQ